MFLKLHGWIEHYCKIKFTFYYNTFFSLLLWRKCWLVSKDMLMEQKNVLSMNGEHFSIENGHMFVQTYHFLTTISMNINFVFICKHIFVFFMSIRASPWLVLSCWRPFIAIGSRFFCTITQIKLDIAFHVLGPHFFYNFTIVQLQ